MMGEIERSPVLAAPSFHNVIAPNSTTNKIDEDEDDFQADEANNLCKRYIPLALKIASKYRDRGVDFEDLRSAAYLGLVQGSRKFDPSRGAFGPYVEHWIAGSVKALFSGNDPLENAVSLTAEDEENEESSHQIDIASPPPVIAPDLTVLGDTDRHIVEARNRGETLVEIGTSLGLSAERVRQRQAAAQSRIRGDQTSEAIADLTTRGKFISSAHQPRRWTDFKDREPPKHAYREPQPSQEIIHHRKYAPRLAALREGRQ